VKVGGFVCATGSGIVVASAALAASVMELAGGATLLTWIPSRDLVYFTNGHE